MILPQNDYISQEIKFQLNEGGGKEYTARISDCLPGSRSPVGGENLSDVSQLGEFCKPEHHRQSSRTGSQKDPVISP